MRATQGKGVDVVFDSVGLATFEHSLDVLAVGGHLVLYGAASGQPPPVEVGRLMRESLTLSRPVLPHYLPDAASLRRQAALVFEDLASGAVARRIDATFALGDAAQAHRAPASRSTQGKLLLAINPSLDGRASAREPGTTKRR